METMIDRTAERMAFVLQIGQNASPRAEMSERQAAAPANPMQPARPDLGPNQLAWLRENVGSFGICERLAVESESHRQRLLDAVRP